MKIIQYGLMALGVLLGPMNAWSETAPTTESSDNFLLGTWARSAAECKKPEFNFSANTLVIKTDGDGTPIRFVYKDVRYATTGTGATLSLRSKDFHPYEHTAKNDQLEFIRNDANHVEIVRTKFGNVPLVRCNKKTKE